MERQSTDAAAPRFLSSGLPLERHAEHGSSIIRTCNAGQGMILGINQARWPAVVSYRYAPMNANGRTQTDTLNAAVSTLLSSGWCRWSVFQFSRRQLSAPANALLAMLPESLRRVPQQRRAQVSWNASTSSHPFNTHTSRSNMGEPID